MGEGKPMCRLVGSLLAVMALLAARAATGTTITLYDASAGGGTQTPDQQGFLYLVSDLVNPLDINTTMSAGGGLTDLNTTFDRAEYAGFLTHNPFDGTKVHPSAPVLDRTTGFTVTFDLQMVSEGHDLRDDNSDLKYDRAGFSVIAISSDKQGIELAFFHDDATQNEIWVYEDDTPNAADLFTQAEGVNRTAAQTGTLTTYDLTILGSNYELSAGGTSILTGSLRDYTNWDGPNFPPFGELDPYEKANMLAFGDDTSSADSHTKLGNISVTLIPEPASIVLLALAGIGWLLCRRLRRPLAR